MKIQIGGLSEGVHEYQFSEGASDLGLTDGFKGDVRVSVTLEKTGKQMVLKGGVTAEGDFVCDRCTRPLSVPVSSSYRMYYVAEGEEFAGVDPAELSIVPGSGTLDITEDVRQTILLAVPLKLLCADSCRGLCPHCGKNLNVESCSCTVEQGDSRWEPLRSLRGSN